MRRGTRIAAWVVGCVTAFVVLSATAVMVLGNIAAGRGMIERLTDKLSGGRVELEGLGGSFPSDLTLSELKLSDRGGVWLRARNIALHWSPLALLEGRIIVRDLRVSGLDMERPPLSESANGAEVAVPDIEVAQFSIDVLQLGARLAGSAATLSARGSGHMHSLEDADANVIARRIDSEGEYRLQFKFDRNRMDGTLAVHEPASGPLENILRLPGLGALSASAVLAGPRSAEHIELNLRAGDLSSRIVGSVDLTKASADLAYSLQAAQVSPRPDIRWQRVALQGRWHGSFTDPTADGQLQIDQLQLPGGAAIAELRASLAAGNGNLSLHGVVEGLRLAGAAANLLARDPLQLDASMRVNEPARPLTVVATHRLLSLHAQATTAGRRSVTLELRLPDLAPYAALAGQSIRGDGVVNAQISGRGSGWGMNLDARANLTGAAGAAIDVLGNHVTLALSGSLSDDAIAIERMQLAGQAWLLLASGSAARTHAQNAAAPPTEAVERSLKDLKVRWDLHVADLAILSSALAGTLHAAGQLRGVPGALAGEASVRSTVSIRGSPPGTLTAQIDAQGLPAAPRMAVKAGGTLDGAPLELVASVEPVAGKGWLATIERATWKSAHADGVVATGSGLADSRGQIRLQLGRLGDLDRLLGANIQGSVDANLTLAPLDGRSHAQFRIDAQDLTLQRFAGALQLTGEGTADSLGLHLSLQAPQFEGAAASLAANAKVNLGAHELTLLSASVGYRAQRLRLLAPSRISYRAGLRLDQLKVGLQDAVLQLDGALSPQLDLRAALLHVEPKLMNLFLPGTVAEGMLEGHATLQGTFSAPTGRITLSARGMRSASDVALGFPALDLDAGADLAGDSASIQVHLNAGKASLLTVTGTAPLNAAGAFNLKVSGQLNIALANALFEARGMHVDGQLAVDATLDGTFGAPQIRGTVTLAQGDLRDYARGFNLTHINAQVAGSAGTLQIRSFNATAAPGTIAMTGSVGLLQPAIPVDLRMSARNAQAISSSLLTSNVDADITVSGTARERITVAGSIHVNRAVIGIPDSLPPDVAVLDVRRRGAAAPVASRPLQVALDVAIDAPRQILVRGRGLDAELGSQRALHVGGTVDAPLVSGDFDLQRGSFTIGSTKLNFSTGRISFDGNGLKKNIDPSLDFTTAQSTAATITAYLHITGYADSPKFEFISVPPGAPQDEILSMLLFGEPAAQLTALQAAQIAAALATLTGVGGGGNPLAKLQKSLGLDSLSVGAGTTTTATGAVENSGAAIAAGRYITKRVYLEGTQSTTGQSQVQINVDLTKHLKVQTRLGNGTAIQGTTPDNDPGSSVGLSYQFEY